MNASTALNEMLRELLDESRRRPLTVEETEKLAALLEAPQPWLEWTGKRETPDFAAALSYHAKNFDESALEGILASLERAGDEIIRQG